MIVKKSNRKKLSWPISVFEVKLKGWFTYGDSWCYTGGHLRVSVANLSYWMSTNTLHCVVHSLCLTLVSSWVQVAQDPHSTREWEGCGLLYCIVLHLTEHVHMYMYIANGILHHRCYITRHTIYAYIKAKSMHQSTYISGDGLRHTHKNSDNMDMWTCVLQNYVHLCVNQGVK